MSAGVQGRVASQSRVERESHTPWEAKRGLHHPEQMNDAQKGHLKCMLRTLQLVSSTRQANSLYMQGQGQIAKVHLVKHIDKNNMVANIELINILP